MRKVILFLLNNLVINRILIVVRKDDLIKKYNANWSKTTISRDKTLQENVGFSHEPVVEEAIKKVHANLQSLANDVKPGSVLDIGCGVGLYLEDFAPGVEKHGTDLSPSFIAVAKERIPEGQFFCGDFMTLSLPKTYDLIFSISVLEYIPPSQVAAFFSRIRENLNPGGWLFIQYPHALSRWQTFYPDLAYVHYSPQRLEAILLRESFEVISHRHSFDDRLLKGKVDSVRYDPEKKKSFRNGAILIAKKK